MFPVSMIYWVLVWSNIDYSSAYVLLKWIESQIHTFSLQHICPPPPPYDLLQSLKYMHKTSVKGPAGMPGLFVNEKFFKTLTLHLAFLATWKRVTTWGPGPNSYLWSHEPNTSKANAPHSMEFWGPTWWIRRSGSHVEEIMSRFCLSMHQEMITTVDICNYNVMVKSQAHIACIQEVRN